MRTTAYRYPNEHLILFLTLGLVFGVVALTVAATVCLSFFFVIAFLALSYYMGRSHHQQLMRSAQRVTPETMPGLAQAAQRCVRRLQPGATEVYVAPGKQVNAYTFGLSSPKVVVLYAGLFQFMDEDEITFILGHEMGHVALGHTWLNSFVGGLAGIPSPWGASALLSMAFLWWNRACEYSADRAGLLACGKPEKAMRALIKLAAGPAAATKEGLALAYQRLDAEDDSIWGSLGEAFGTHPLLIRRIQELQRYSQSDGYQRLQSMMARND